LPQPSQQDFVNLTNAMSQLAVTMRECCKSQGNASKKATAAKAATPNKANTNNINKDIVDKAKIDGNAAGTKFGDNFSNAFKKKIKAANVYVNLSKYFMNALKGAFSILTSFIGFIIGIIGTLWQKLVEMWEWYESILRKVYDATGLVGAEAQHVRQQVVGVTNQYVRLGVTMESAAEAAGAITEEFGNIGTLTSNTLGTVSLLKTTMGVAESEGAKLVKIFMSMSKYSEAQTKSTIASIKEMAIMAKVAPRKVMQDIAKNSEFVYKYFRGSKENATKFAVIINSIGKSMDIMKGAADSLMEWDSSIENEMNASVLLGRTVDFSAARMKVFKGDMAGALDDIIKQVGSADKLSKMSIYQHKAIADATGMSTEALIEMVSMQEKMNKFESSYGKLAGKSIAEQKKLLEIAKQRGDANAEAVLTQNIQQTQTEKFKAMQEELKMKFLELAQKFFPIILKVIDGLGVVFNYAGEGIKKIISALGGGGAINSIANDIGKMVETVGKFFIDVVLNIVLWIISHQDDIAGAFRWVKDVLVAAIPYIEKTWEKIQGIGSALESFFGMFVSGNAKTNKNYWIELGIVVAAFWGTLKLIPLLNVFGSMIKGAWTAATAFKATSAAATTTASTASTAGAGLSTFLTNLGLGMWQLLEGIAQGVKAFGNPQALGGAIVLTGIIIGIAFALSLLEGVIKVVVDAFVRLVEVIVSNGASIKLILEGVATVFRTIFDGIATYIKTVFEGIANLITAPMRAVGEIIKGVFDSVAKIVENVGNSIVKIINAITDSIVRMTLIPTGKITFLAGELLLLGGAIAGMGIGSAIGGIGSFIGSAFGSKNLIDQIKELSSYSDAIDKTARSIQALKVSFSNFKLPTFNEDSLDNMKELIESVADLAAESRIVINSEVNYNNKELVKKMDDIVKAIINIEIRMDGREVGRMISKNTSSPFS